MRAGPIGATALISAGAACGVAGLYFVWLRPWHLSWGARADELQMPLPGDHAIPTPQIVATRAIDIAAPPEAVWPWLVQMGGYTRAGMVLVRLDRQRGNPECDDDRLGIAGSA